MHLLAFFFFFSIEQFPELSQLSCEHEISCKTHAYNATCPKYITAHLVKSCTGQSILLEMNSVNIPRSSINAVQDRDPCDEPLPQLTSPVGDHRPAAPAHPSPGSLRLGFQRFFGSRSHSQGPDCASHPRRQPAGSLCPGTGHTQPPLAEQVYFFLLIRQKKRE